MENENPVSDQDDPWARMPDETDQEYERRLQRRRRSREKRELADTLKALTEKSRDVALREDHGEHSEEEEVAEGRAEPPDPVAAEKAEREKCWAEAEKKEAQEDDLTRHWEKARIAEIDARGGLAPLRHGFPPTDTGHWPLPRVTRPAEDRAPRYVRPDAPPDDAETELTAIIAECRYFMRAMAFESARLTPDAGDRFGFIDRACKLAEAGARVGKTVAGLRGRESDPPKEHRQHITIDDRRRGASEEGEGGAP